MIKFPSKNKSFSVLVVLLFILSASNGEAVDYSPELNSPADFSYEEGTTGHYIIWIATDTDPDNYAVYCSNNRFTNGTWISGSDIFVSVTGLAASLIGTRVYNITIIVQDLLANRAFDSVLVSVTESNGGINVPTITQTNPPSEGLPADMKIMLVLIVVVMILIFAFIYKAKNERDKRK